MLIPSPNYIIIETTKEVFEKHTSSEKIDPYSSRLVISGTVYAVGDTQFSENPVKGDGVSFSWARKPEAFPLTNGEEVVCTYWEHATAHEGKYLFIISKDAILGVYRKREEVQAGLFDSSEEPIASER